MIWFIVRRFLGLILTLWIVFTLSFLLMHAVPGGPYSSERNLPKELEENFKEKYQLNLPIWEQYWNRLREAVTGDLGPSQRLLDFSVNEVIAQGLPVSACLGILALAFALTLGLSAGIVSALYRGSAADVALMSLATIGIALPSFVIGGLSIMLFVFVIPIFPAAGWGTLRQLVLPAICLGSVYAAEVARSLEQACSTPFRRILCALPAQKDLASLKLPFDTRYRPRCCRWFHFSGRRSPAFSQDRWSSSASLRFPASAGTSCRRQPNATTPSRWDWYSCTRCFFTR